MIVKRQKFMSLNVYINDIFKRQILDILYVYTDVCLQILYIITEPIGDRNTHIDSSQTKPLVSYPKRQMDRY